MILFSSIYPNEQILKDELYGCFAYIKIPFDVLDRMPVRDRKYYIMKHNESIEAINNKSKRNTKNNMLSGDAINAYTDIEQNNLANLNK